MIAHEIAEDARGVLAGSLRQGHNRDGESHAGDGDHRSGDGTQHAASAFRACAKSHGQRAISAARSTDDSASMSPKASPTAPTTMSVGRNHRLELRLNQSCLSRFTKVQRIPSELSGRLAARARREAGCSLRFTLSPYGLFPPGSRVIDHVGEDLSSGRVVGRSGGQLPAR